MKRFVTLYILPLLIATLVVYLFAINKTANKVVFSKESKVAPCKSLPRYISTFAENPSFQEAFLKTNDTSETIYLFGSSELSHVCEAIPYNFISQHFKTQVIGIGHAGNQSLSIYAQLLANEEHLPNAPIVIIVSPGWFESRASKGTSSEVFLEYLSETFLRNILKNKNNAEFNPYLFKRVSQLYDEFSSPSLELKLMNFKHCASKSFIHQALYSPLIYVDDALLSMKETINKKTEPNSESIQRHAITPEEIAINWDSLYSVSKQDVTSKSMNNQMGINDAYFTEHIHSNKGGHIEAVSEQFNQELKDFVMLLKLLKAKKVNARLIISPLNALYYRNLEAILPTMQLVENEIQQSGFPCLNLFAKDKTTYDKALLSDVMHISDYGWYKIDRFIVETYKLAK